MSDTDSLIPLLLDIADVATLIAIGERTLWRWISVGAFPPPDISVGAKYRRWKRATVEQWIAAQTGEGGGQ
jgi:predicted DNA-binding transcriptional regulator AlpA